MTTIAPDPIDTASGFYGAPSAPTPDEISRMKAVARGDIPGDVAIRGGRVVTVHTCEIIPADVVLSGRHIAAVVPHGRLDARETVDATDRFVAPTFADAHIHMDYTLLTPSELARVVVPRGTTHMFADPVCLANVLGVLGMDLAAVTAAPMRIFQQVTPDVPRRGRYQLGGASVPHEHILDRITWPNSTSVGESSPFLDDAEMCELMSVALTHGRRATGHTARLDQEPLWAYLAGGVGDDHNAATWPEVLERVRRGMAVTIQAGSMSDYCEEILGDPARLGMVAQHLCFCADDKHIEDLYDQGHIDHHVRSAVELGVDPALAIRMASLNAAMHFRVDHLIGSIAPTRLADLQILGDLTEFVPSEVWVDGEVVARDGEALFTDADPVPDAARGTVNLGPIDATAFEVPADTDEPTALVRAMEMYDGYYKRALVAEADVVDGKVMTCQEHDLAKIVVVDRHQASGAAGIGFVRGFGLRNGALAATTNCDNQNVVAIGTDDAQLEAAVKALDRLGGGYVVIENGEVAAQLPLPYAGIISDQPWEIVLEQSREVNAAARAIGCPIHAPFMILAFVGLPGVPDYGLTELGLIDVTRQEAVGLVLEDFDGPPDCRCVQTGLHHAHGHAHEHAHETDTPQ
ncbi:adenine deaminase [Ilumatobacter coccineus]|uniref:Adenine deaminase n=1 Tax=Ilumatobacter coccineus (strain NBRC 103263 / KCTC 29153 / YM16-304) TaxID=1313172 RepID=A0A6C7DTP0_ILUCY|nr:adenine deaminase C-terminal domain-containing protein [Ilumatobacter coccineus]BAN00364.1 adenine deaminase [Ilumatobacter coccineus YM16-304]